MEATAVKTGKRMEQALDKQAQALIQTVKIARTEAFEAELSELNGKFRTNKPFMFQIAAISKNESLVQLFDGTWDKEDAPLENLMSPSPQQPSSSKLRQGITKWKHVVAQQPQLVPLLVDACLSQRVKSVLAFQELNLQDKMEMVMMACGVIGDFKFVSKLYVDVKLLSEVVDIVKERITLQNGFFSDWTYDNLKKGYYQRTQAGVACSLLKGDGSVCDDVYAGPDGSTDYIVENKFNPNSEVTFLNDGLENTVKDIKSWFVAKGAVYPQFGAEAWVVDGWTIDDPQARLEAKKESAKKEKEDKKQKVKGKGASKSGGAPSE